MPKRLPLAVLAGFIALWLAVGGDDPLLGREIAQPRRYSEISAHEVDTAVAHLLDKAEKRAGEVIAAHRPGIETLVASLEREGALVRAEIERHLGPAKGRGGPVAAVAE